MFVKIVKGCVLVLGVLLGAAGAVELLFGTWFSAAPLDRLDLPRARRAVVSAHALYPGGGEVLYRRDVWGFRGDNPDPSRIAILTIGGTTTSQPALIEEQTWQRALERQFQSHGRDGVVVANAGIDGQSSVGHLRNLRQWLAHVPGLHPRFVLAFVGLGEIDDGVAAADILSHDDAPSAIRRKSGLLRLARRLRDLGAIERLPLEHRRAGNVQARWVGAGSEPVPLTESELAAYRFRLKSMADEIHALGAVPVFITQARGDFRRVGGRVQGIASERGPNGVDRYNALARLNAATRDVCVRQGLLCLDLAAELEFAAADFYDFSHCTPAGAEKIGRWLYGKLAGLV